ncbi:hypothetical protein AB1Y20_006057 [Prymnesium parvum]|uniref:Uncharacterized protein n=1 Tax=Prymnesium parvum TaxID=97485 RepID=A0AB34J167_PRYPA
MASASTKRKPIDDNAIDWLLVKHAESDDAIRATRGAFDYLRQLKQSIPTPVVSSTRAITLDDDDADGLRGGLDGSHGITEAELAEREEYAQQERDNLILTSDDDDDSPWGEQRQQSGSMARSRMGDAAARKARGEGGGVRRVVRTRECVLRLKLLDAEGKDVGVAHRLSVSERQLKQGAARPAAARAPAPQPAVRLDRTRREEEMLEKALRLSQQEFVAAGGRLHEERVGEGEREAACGVDGGGTSGSDEEEDRPLRRRRGKGRGKANGVARGTASSAGSGSEAAAGEAPAAAPAAAPPPAAAPASEEDEMDSDDELAARVIAFRRAAEAHARAGLEAPPVDPRLGLRIAALPRAPREGSSAPPPRAHAAAPPPPPPHQQARPKPPVEGPPARNGPWDSVASSGAPGAAAVRGGEAKGNGEGEKAEGRPAALKFEWSTKASGERRPKERRPELQEARMRGAREGNGVPPRSRSTEGGVARRGSWTSRVENGVGGKEARANGVDKEEKGRGDKDRDKQERSEKGREEPPKLQFNWAVKRQRSQQRSPERVRRRDAREPSPPAAVAPREGDVVKYIGGVPVVMQPASEAEGGKARRGGDEDQQVVGQPESVAAAELNGGAAREGGDGTPSSGGEINVEGQTNATAAENSSEAISLLWEAEVDYGELSMSDEASDADGELVQVEPGEDTTNGRVANGEANGEAKPVTMIAGVPAYASDAAPAAAAPAGGKLTFSWVSKTVSEQPGHRARHRPNHSRGLASDGAAGRLKGRPLGAKRGEGAARRVEAKGPGGAREQEIRERAPAVEGLAPGSLKWSTKIERGAGARGKSR